MSGLFVTFLVLFVAVCILWRHYGWFKKKEKTPRQEPSFDRRDDVEDNLHLSPVTAARAKAAQPKSSLSVAPALRGATRVSMLPPPTDYSKYEEPTFLRRGVQLSFG